MPLTDGTLALENAGGSHVRATLTQGVPELIQSISRHLEADVGWKTPSEDLGLIVTSGTSGALWLAFGR